MFWDVFGRTGQPGARHRLGHGAAAALRACSNLNDTQEGVLTLVFKIADDNGLLLLDLKDLRAMLQHVGDNAKQFTTEYGNVSAASIGAIQRGLLALEQQGGDKFFGEPALNIADLMQTDARARRGQHPRRRQADEVAQALRDACCCGCCPSCSSSCPKSAIPRSRSWCSSSTKRTCCSTTRPRRCSSKIEQVVRLIRSKGVGVYFVTQNPLDIPDTVLGQLGNRVQHALRAFTPRDQKAVKAAATTLRANPKLNTEKVITELAVGEALVSFLDEKGRPTVVERAFIVPPASRIGPITPQERQTAIKSSLVTAITSRPSTANRRTRS